MAHWRGTQRWTRSGFQPCPCPLAGLATPFHLARPSGSSPGQHHGSRCQVGLLTSRYLQPLSCSALTTISLPFHCLPATYASLSTLHCLFTDFDRPDCLPRLPPHQTRTSPAAPLFVVDCPPAHLWWPACVAVLACMPSHSTHSPQALPPFKRLACLWALAALPLAGKPHSALIETQLLVMTDRKSVV